MIEVRNVSFSYGRKPILTGLSFSAAAGECAVLAGPNGSGKSTALAIAAGVLRPKEGEVYTEGGVGYVPQGTALFEDMTVGDNLKFFAGLAGCPVPEALPFHVEKWAGTAVRKLSVGMKKQVSIACALLGEPKCLLLDEPCAGLDVAWREELKHMICTWKAEGRAIVYVSHEPAEFAPFWDRLVFLGREGAAYTRDQLPDERKLSETFLTLFQTQW